MNQRLKHFILTLGLSLLLALPALAVPGGPQAVIYSDNGVKVLRPPLFIPKTGADSPTQQEMLQIYRTGGSAGAGVNNRMSMITFKDADNPTYIGAIGSYRLSPSNDYFGGLSFYYNANVQTSAYASLTEGLRLVHDGSLQFMQQIATPATPASGSIKLYVKSDDTLYALNDSGTELRVTPKVPTIQTFTSGSGTYTTPAGVLWIRVIASGGGGGGGGSGTASHGTGGNGGATTFGSSLLTANGGTGANIATAPGGAGGSATVASPAIGVATTGSEGNGSGQNAAVGAGYPPGGSGGMNARGGRGGGGTSNQPGQAPVANTGGGGGGAGCTNAAVCDAGRGGGAGGYLDAIIGTPSATYSYAVGAAGTGGSAGTSGNAGGAGAAGIIIVEEHYN